MKTRFRRGLRSMPHLPFRSYLPESFDVDFFDRVDLRQMP